MAARARLAARHAGAPAAAIAAGCRRERRRDAALSFLARNAGDWDDSEREALAEAVLALIADAAFRAGVRRGQPRRGFDRRAAGAAGTAAGAGLGADRPAGGDPSEVLIVDYKTNHAPPGLPAEAPSAYVRQLALYRAVLEKLYPQLPVRAALLWTETPEMMEIPAPALDAELASVSGGMCKLDPARARS